MDNENYQKAKYKIINCNIQYKVYIFVKNNIQLISILIDFVISNFTYSHCCQYKEINKIK